MSLDHAFYAVLAYTICREVFFMFTVHKLVNKLMCRSLHEYRLAESVYQKKDPGQTEFKENEFDREDMGSLQGII